MLSEAQAKVVTQIARSIVPSLKQAKLYKGPSPPSTCFRHYYEYLYDSDWRV